jgi:hypothetical protein
MNDAESYRQLSLSTVCGRGNRHGLVSCTVADSQVNIGVYGHFMVCCWGWRGGI